MEADEIHVFATPMFRDLEQIAYTLEAAGTGKIRSDLVQRNRDDRIHFDLPTLHSVPLTHRNAGPMPYTNAARDRAGSHPIAQILYEQHAASLDRC